MTKKTFEVTIKTTITLTELQHNFFWSMSFDDRDEAAFKIFNKNYDWDALLNGTKFNRYVTKFMIEESTDPGFICEQFFIDNETVYNKIEKAYLKVVAENKKKCPIIESEYRVVLSGTKQQIKESFELINNSTCAVSIDEL